MSDYNPRYGGVGGRVGKDDFSIDGKSWNYRDPMNQAHRDRQRQGWEGRGQDPGARNEHAHDYSNALYDYSYGQARDAAKALGIGNVNSQEETDRIIDYIQNPPKAESEQKDKKDKDKMPKAEAPATPVAPSKEVTEAKERVNAYDAEMKSDRFNAYGPKKSAFAERSSEVYNPNQGFQANQQSTVSTDGNQQAQTFMQGKLNKTKNDFNLQPTLK